MYINKTMTTIIVAAVIFATACNNREYSPSRKDLGQNMLDLKIYQENMGDHIKAGQLEDAVWLFEGMDSILQVVNVTFDGHHKLDRPFSEYYDLKIKKPVNDLRQALKKNDKAAALEGYRILVRRCNSCHKDLDINKEVRF